MPTYGYVCATCGEYEVIRPMAAANSPAPCPMCADLGRRVFGAPALRSLAPGVRSALDAGVRSADAPTVVSSPPPRTTGRIQRRVTDPRQARLPRP